MLKGCEKLSRVPRYPEGVRQHAQPCTASRVAYPEGITRESLSTPSRAQPVELRVLHQKWPARGGETKSTANDKPSRTKPLYPHGTRPGTDSSTAGQLGVWANCSRTYLPATHLPLGPNWSAANERRQSALRVIWPGRTNHGLGLRKSRPQIVPGSLLRFPSIRSTSLRWER